MILGRIAGLFDPVGWKQRLAALRGRWFDARHGVETVKRVPVAALGDIDPAAAHHAVHYEPTSIPKFERALALLDIDAGSYTFIDFGSGKGRALMLAAGCPFRKIIGVEISASLHAEAETNVAAFRLRNPDCPPIECICADARDFELPAGNLLAYFYNPFDAEIMLPVAGRLRAICESQSHSLVVVYINPLHGDIFGHEMGMKCLLRDPALAIYRMLGPDLLRD